MRILCADDLNFAFDVEIRCRASHDKDDLHRVFTEVKAGPDRIIQRKRLYDIYVGPVVQAVSRQTVSSRQTTQINAEREQISGEIRQKIMDDLAGTPMYVSMINITNLDFPDIITKANEAKKEREIDIEIARNQASVEVEKAEGQLRVANKEYQVALLEAKRIADANRIIGQSLMENPLFLYWHQIKVYGEAATGPNNVFVIPYDAMGGGEGGGFFNTVFMQQALERVTAEGGIKPSGELEAALQRAEAAKAAADEAERKFGAAVQKEEQLQEEGGGE